MADVKKYDTGKMSFPMAILLSLIFMAIVSVLIAMFI